MRIYLQLSFPSTILNYTPKRIHCLNVMANRKFCYFYTPTWDYPPEGPIKLRNVISSVKKPHLPLFTAPPLDKTGIFTTEKKSAECTKEKLRSGRFSILTKFLSVFGFGVDVGAEVERRFVLRHLILEHNDPAVAMRKHTRSTLSKRHNSSRPPHIFKDVSIQRKSVAGWTSLAIASLSISSQD